MEFLTIQKKIQNQQKYLVETDVIAEPRWKSIFKLAVIFTWINLLIIILAIVAFFVWPPFPDNILTLLHEDKLAGLMSLDFLYLLSNLTYIPLLIAFYISLKRTDASYALIGFILGVIAVILIITTRPILELFRISDLYYSATTELDRIQYLAVAESLLQLFDGTAALINYYFAYLSGLIYSILMLKTKIFSKKAAYAGIISCIAGFSLLIPVIGIPLALIALIGAILQLIWVIPSFYQLASRAQVKLLKSTV